MSLNIKNERTHALVRELATLSGMSQTEAVEDAVTRRLEQLRGENENEAHARVERIMRLSAELSSRLKPKSFEDVNEWLYDENGLPK
jgi:antitoxin VapB